VGPPPRHAKPMNPPDFLPLDFLLVVSPFGTKKAYPRGEGPPSLPSSASLGLSATAWHGVQSAMSGLAAVWRQLASLDLDEIFSYQTTKEVRMLDRRLGMVCWLIRAVVLVYVIGYVFVLREGYTETETSLGHCVTSVNGTAYSTTSGVTRPWDAIDAVKPSLEDGAAFVATTVFVTTGQTINNFSNPTLPCSTATAAKDCPNDPPLSYGVCSNGFCQQYGWQPAFSETDGTSTTKHELETADGFGVWLRASIAFPSLDESRIFSTIGAQRITPYGGSGSGATVVASTESGTTLGGSGGAGPPDYYTIGELLALAGARHPSAPLSPASSPSPTACRSTLFRQHPSSCMSPPRESPDC
jgi:hypothetical protein